MDNENPNEAQKTETNNLEQAIADSARSIEQQNQVPVRNPGGRPRGSRNKTKRKRQSRRLVSSESNTTPPEPMNFDDVEPQTPPTPPPDLSPFIGPVISLPFAVVANKTGFDGFSLSEEEQKALVPQVNAVLLQYMPQAIESPHAPAFMLAGTIAILAFTKYSAFKSWEAIELKKLKQAEEKKSEPEKTETSMFTGFPVMQAT